LIATLLDVVQAQADAYEEATDDAEYVTEPPTRNRREE